MKGKVLNLILVLTSFMGYLEWGGENSMFLIEGEWDVLYKLFTSPTEVIHPLTLLPLAGQILLLITLFQKTPSRALTILGIIGIATLLVFMSFIGIISMNWKIFASTLPFVFTLIITIRQLRQSKSTA